VLKKEILISFDKKRDIFVKKNTVLLKKYSKKNYSNKIYGYGSGHPTKKPDLSKWMTDRL